MATVAELQTRLANVQLAIDAVQTGGQEYKIADGLIDTWMRRGDLDALYREQMRLEKRIARISDTGGFIAI
jgi:hypothetical protein